MIPSYPYRAIPHCRNDTRVEPYSDDLCTDFVPKSSYDTNMVPSHAKYPRTYLPRLPLPQLRKSSLTRPPSTPESSTDSIGDPTLVSSSRAVSCMKGPQGLHRTAPELLAVP